MIRFFIIHNWIRFVVIHNRIRFEAFNLAFEVGARLSQVWKRIERLSTGAANIFDHVSKVEVQVEGFDHVEHFDPVAFVVVPFFFHRFLSIVEGGASLMPSAWH